MRMHSRFAHTQLSGILSWPLFHLKLPGFPETAKKDLKLYPSRYPLGSSLLRVH